MSYWLNGRRVVVTRPQDQADELCNRLRAIGAEPVVFPTIAIVPSEGGGPLDQAIARLANYNWIIFTSVNGVKHFWARLMEHLQKDRGAEKWGSVRLTTAPRPPAPSFQLPELKIAAIGPATARALRRRGAPVHLMPAEYRAEAILDEIGEVANQRILLPRADIARPALTDGLRAMGARVDEVAAYRTTRGTPPPAAFDALRAGVDAITFTSSSTVHNFVALTAGLDYGDPFIACIGPVTADTARNLSLRVDAVAKEYTIDGLIEALQLIENGCETQNVKCQTSNVKRGIAY